jgi:hypothetical protein
MFYTATSPPEWTETIRRMVEVRKNDERNWLSSCNRRTKSSSSWCTHGAFTTLLIGVLTSTLRDLQLIQTSRVFRWCLRDALCVNRRDGLVSVLSSDMAKRIWNMWDRMWSYSSGWGLVSCWVVAVLWPLSAKFQNTTNNTTRNDRFSRIIVSCIVLWTTFEGAYPEWGGAKRLAFAKAKWRLCDAVLVAGFSTE